MSSEAVQPARTSPGPGLRLLVVGSGWRFVSGISYYTWHLVTALRQHGHEAGAILMRCLLPRRLYPGRERVGQAVSAQQYEPTIPVHDGVDWWGIPSLFRAVRFLRAQHPDVIVFEWWTATVLHSYLVLLLAGRASGAKIVVEFHEVLDSAELRVPFVSRYSRAIARLIVRRLDGAIVHSEYDRELLRATYGLAGIPLVVAPHGPYDHLRSGAPAPQSDQSPPETCNLLFFGTIRPYKGLEHLIEAFGLLSPDEVVGYRLTVVGETWEGWTLPGELIAASAYGDRIHFVNRYVDDAEAAVAFQAADAVVLPYLRSSASGPLHIAMSQGLPVAVTCVGGLQEAAAAYEGTVFVPPADPVALAAALRRLRSMRGCRFEDPHSWGRTVAAVEELAARMLQPPTRGSLAASANRAG